MRVVLDPNVLVSAAVASGISAQLLERWLIDRPFEVVVCPALIGELGDVLTRDRFRRWMSTDEAERFVTRLESEAEPWDDPVDVPAVTADPEDDYLVAFYRDWNADLLVSGESDLTDLHAERCHRAHTAGPTGPTLTTAGSTGRGNGYRSCGPSSACSEF